MLYIVTFGTWVVSIFTNIYLYKLLFGKSACIFTSISPITSSIFILFSPIVSILLFIRLVIHNSCEFSTYILSMRVKSCVSCANFTFGKCNVYDLTTRKKMLCKGEFHYDKGT